MVNEALRDCDRKIVTARGTSKIESSKGKSKSNQNEMAVIINGM